jgi:ribosomal protein S18 acetylase RimI-like enzyme
MPAHLQPALTFQGFDKEINQVSSKWRCDSQTSFLIALNTESQEALGCVALRPLNLHSIPENPVTSTPLDEVIVVSEGERRKKVCEMKRLYADPAVRGQGLGKKLVLAILQEGRRLGYDEMMLDTVPDMAAAIGLYQSLGFERCEKYNETPAPGIVFFKKDLRMGGRS